MIFGHQRAVHRHRAQRVDALVQENPLGELGAPRGQFRVLVKGVVNVVSLVGRNGDVLLAFVKAGRQVDLRRRGNQVPPLRLEGILARLAVGELHQLGGFGLVLVLSAALQDPDMVHVGFRPGRRLRVDLLVQLRGVLGPPGRLVGAGQHQQAVHVHQFGFLVLLLRLFKVRDRAIHVAGVHPFLADGPVRGGRRVPTHARHDLLAAFRPRQEKPSADEQQHHGREGRDADADPVDRAQARAPALFGAGGIGLRLFLQRRVLVVYGSPPALEGWLSFSSLAVPFLGFGNGVHGFPLLLPGILHRGHLDRRAARPAAAPAHGLRVLLPFRGPGMAPRRGVPYGFPRALSLADHLRASARGGIVAESDDLTALRTHVLFAFRKISAFGTQHSGPPLINS